MNNLLLTHKEMDQKYKEFNEKGFSPPYFYKIEKGGKHLFFLGTKHMYDPKDKQSTIIKKYWLEFLKLTNKKNCIVLVEAGLPPVATIEEEATRKFAETGLAIYLASREGIAYDCPEPDRKFEARELVKKLSKEEIMYYYFARQVAQWHRFVDRPDFDKYFELFFRGYKQVTGWKDFDFSIANLIKIHNAIHNHKFDIDNYNCFYNDSNPSLSKVSRTSGIIRNIHIFGEIKKLWDEGKNIFIVYGSGHFIVLERAIKSLAT